MRSLLLSTLLTVSAAGIATGQTTLSANAVSNNFLSTPGSALFFDVEARFDSRITHLSTASFNDLGDNFDVEVFVRSGSGLGNPGPGQDPTGWVSLGLATGTQNGVSVLEPSGQIDIPDILVPCNTVVGVALVFPDSAPRYFGTGPAPLQTFSDGDLTLTTGDSRTAPFTTGGGFFSSRGLVGDLTYEVSPVASALRMTDALPGTFIDISSTGTPLSLSDDGEADIVTAIGNSLFAAGTVRVGSNGAVRFAGAGQNLSFINAGLPSPNAFDGDQALMPFWDDINTSGGLNGEIYWEEVGDQLIVQWDGVDFFGGALDTATFQLQVNATGPIPAQFVYVDIEGARAAGGASATIGYQAGGVSNTYQYGLNAPAMVRDGSVISIVNTQVLMTDQLAGSFIDISATGTALSLSDDGEIDIITTVGNDLLAAGTVRVGSNGGLRFDGTGSSLGFSNTNLPSANAFAGDQTLLPFWDDIDTASGAEGEIYWQEIGDTLIVQWDAVEFFPGGTGGVETATFQVQVHGSGPAYAQYVYADVSSVRADGGVSATIGYQGGMIGGDAAYSFNIAGAVNDGTVLSLTDGRDTLGTNYCVANLNSTGVESRISATGSPSIACDNLELTASNLPANSFGFFICSRDTGFVPFAGGAAGNICLGGSIGRGVGVGILNSGPDGSITTPAMLSSLPTPTGPVAAIAGDTWNFQAWHRDAVGGVATSNFTGGLQVQFIN